MDDWHLLVGLGNPGKEYVHTRHNAGFMVLELLAERWHANWRLEAKFQARLAKAERGGRRVLLCQPQTFMNLSGEAVQAVGAYYQIPASRMVIAVDDADLPLGEIRMRPKGGNGGHHGLESVEQHVGTREYARLRIGIGRRTEGQRMLTGHVLGSFDSNEQELLKQVLAKAASQLECWVTAGIEPAMNQFNGPIEGLV
ncbi:MAG: aminoacyl-tRNA hydrolase [Verrucomicrobiota bacterium]